MRYNIATDAVDVGPIPIAQAWPLPADFRSDITASVNWGNGFTYFFKGASYVRYNIATDVAEGPLLISQYWQALPADFHSDIDAAVNWGNGIAYFFKGARYVRYIIAKDEVTGPELISQYWPALPAEFQSNLDSVVNWGNGIAYFFKGARYVRYQIKDNTVSGPETISQYWPALPSTFQTNVRAAINWTFPNDLAGLMRAAGLTVNEVGDWRARVRPGAFTPIGVVIHHTGGANSLGVVVNGRADLAGPLANLHVAKNGVISIVSKGPANHAGPGARQVLDEVAADTAPSGTALNRRFLDGPGGNKFFYGIENDNRGDGVDPWPDEQMDTITRAAVALCHLHCWSSTRVIGHKEWTRRKPDPTIDMAQFRARVLEML